MWIMEARILQQTFPKDARIIVMGDIHTNKKRFLQILADIHYQPSEDFLIINGDILEKGTNNIETLAFFREMIEKTPKMIMLEGNCERYIVQGGNIVAYLRQRGQSIIGEWLEEQGVDIHDEMLTEARIYQILHEHYQDELEWLDHLPTALVTPDYLFVHAAAGRGNVNEALSDYGYILTKRAFLLEEHDLEQTVVVGHYPVANYCQTKLVDYSAVNAEGKRIIALDGGNQIDEGGQLNALVITYKDGVPTEAFYSVDEFEEIIILEDFQGENQFVRHAFWPYGFEEGAVIEKGKFFSLCQVKDMDEPIIFKNEYVTFLPNNQYRLERYHSGCFMDVRKGDFVKVVDSSTEGYVYVKKNGVVGWVPAACIGEVE